VIPGTIARFEDDEVAFWSRVTFRTRSNLRKNSLSMAPNLAAYHIAKGAKGGLEILVVSIRVEPSERDPGEVGGNSKLFTSLRDNDEGPLTPKLAHEEAKLEHYVVPNCCVLLLAKAECIIWGKYEHSKVRSVESFDQTLNGGLGKFEDPLLPDSDLCVVVKVLLDSISVVHALI